MVRGKNGCPRFFLRFPLFEVVYHVFPNNTKKKERKKEALFFGTMKTPFYAWQRKISSDIYKLEAS
jgi:hypothetical protein